MSVYRHRNSPYWQFDFQRAGYRFCGSTEVPKTRPKREAEVVEAQERRAAERLIEEVRRSGRQPMTFAAAADRWWNEVGQHSAETDLHGAVEWLKAQIGPAKPLHLVGNDDVTRATTERRTHQIRAGRDRDGTQLWRPIGPRTVNRTVPLLLRRIFRRAARLWDVVIFREPNWTEHLLAEPKRSIREITLAEEEAIEALEASYHAIRRLTVIIGLRKRESLLTWPQIDFENRLVRIIGKLRNEFNHCMYTLNERGESTHTHSIRLQEVKGKLQLGVIRKMDDARINNILAAIQSMTKLNREIWDFLPRLQDSLRASSENLDETS